MKIAIFRTDNSFLNISQYNCQEIGLGKSLLDAGHEVYLIVATDDIRKNDYPDYVQHGSQRINIVKLAYRLVPTLGYPLLGDIDRTFKKIHPDICHINEESCPATLQVALYAKKHSVPIVIYHGMYSTPESRIRILYEKLHDKLFRPWLRNNVKHVFAKTSKAHKYLLQRKYLNSSILPVGLDVSSLVERAELNVDERIIYLEKKNVIYVGVFEKRRNIVFLMKLAQECRDYDNVHFTFIGTGPEFDFAKNFIDAHQLTNVTLTGPLTQSRLSFFYENASLFLMASNYEIFGMVYLEAMYFGLPIVTNLNAGSIDLVASENGVIIGTLDVTLWKQEIYKILSTSDSSVKSQIREKFLNNYTWNRIASNYLATVEKLVSSR